MTTTCELCGAEASGRYLCERHTVKLAASLDALPALHAELAIHLVPRRTGPAELVTAGAAGPRSPLNEDVLDLVHGRHMTEVMESWREDVQRVRWPQHTPPPPAGLASACRWLAMELEWVVSHYPAAGDLAREVRELEDAALSIVGAPRPRPQRLGTCVAVGTDGVVCGAVVSRLPGQCRVTCRWCGYTYESERDWLMLLHLQPKESA
ncbi:hypothetical protein ACH49_22445 [Streptomyces leeuwenhoekii]|uniref:Uncharacterized protein n=1 Tax=Streptomyces leeuwenhoekii TaxID=1437453 RepID=A0ABR5HUA5_STRLW|nr:hypothetical protein [Streptomyces leeuwenhoekii]KMS74531.1 hypothetical protein ACH49_22445 [Streptomyces leeuwenhoekii]